VAFSVFFTTFGDLAMNNLNKIDADIRLYRDLVYDIVEKRLSTLPNYREGDLQQGWLDKSLMDLLPPDSPLVKQAIEVDPEDVIDRIITHEEVIRSLNIPNLASDYTRADLRRFGKESLIALESTYSYKIGTYLSEIEAWGPPGNTLTNIVVEDSAIGASL